MKTDSRGLILGLLLTPGQCHESTQFAALMEAGPLCGPEGLKTASGQWPQAVGGDKAYSSTEIREWCMQRDIDDVIPTRSNETPQPDFDKAQYRRRNIVERAIGWLKECRRVMTRFEKYALHYAGMVWLAIIQRCLKGLSNSLLNRICG